MIHIAATFGDPTSIGPEVATAAIKKLIAKRNDVIIHVFAPRQFKINSKKIIWHDSIESSTFIAGKPGQRSGARALFDLSNAADACISKQCHALVTGPIDKYWCAKSDSKFTGHTEYLEKRTRSKKSTMLLEGPKLRVALVTTHIPLAKVSSNISSQKIIATAKNVCGYLKSFIHRPRLAICGLNPHASDKGLFGNEEQEIILPAIRKLKSAGIRVDGPLSADSLFHRTDPYDAVICMYHDQGLIPLKMRHFYDAINITLGLPFIRTSVDHGTAFDIAGKAKASSISYGQALQHAYDWVKRSRRK